MSDPQRCAHAETSWHPTGALGRSCDRRTRDRVAGAGFGGNGASRARRNRTSPKKRESGQGKVPKNISLTDNLSNAAINIQGQKTEVPPNTFSSSSSSMDTEGSKTEKKNDKDVIEENCTSVTDALQQIGEVRFKP